jgi:hypothetical protein
MKPTSKYFNMFSYFILNFINDPLNGALQSVAIKMRHYQPPIKKNQSRLNDGCASYLILKSRDPKYNHLHNENQNQLRFRQLKE